jgi:hypothetical protein
MLCCQATIQVCRFLSCSDDLDQQTTGTHLLNWLLSESNRIDHSVQKYPVVRPEMEQVILDLPDPIKFQEPTKRRIAFNWAIRGNVIRNVLDWRSGEETLLALLSNLKFRDWAGFVLLNWRYSIKENQNFL